ncbi:MAG: cation transporter [Bacteroidetes bacterium]|nr:MAG: cation transporter [Bacteroidota bacterium]
MGHHHHHHEVSGKRLAITIFLNVLITLGELVGGIISGSMALITDAAHNFSDVLSLIISYVANRMAKRKPTAQQTFGYRRSEIIAAFANSVTLIVIALIIFYEAINRLADPIEIKSGWVIIMAGASILLNGVSVLLIKRDAKHNMNMRSAFLHLFSDMMTSVGVLASGLIMKFYNWYYADAIFSMLIASYLLDLSWAIFRDSLRILMQFTPENIDIESISKEISIIAGIRNIHHVHAWQLDDHKIIFEAHIDLDEDISVSQFETKLADIKKILLTNGIDHSNIQPEFNMKDDKALIHDL